MLMLQQITLKFAKDFKCSPVFFFYLTIFAVDLFSKQIFPFLNLVTIFVSFTVVSRVKEENKTFKN